MGMSSELCFRLARNKVIKRQAGEAGANRATFDKASYRQWRQSELNQQFMQYFSAADVAQRDVVDFGCGEGELSFLMATLGVRSITGLEISPDRHKAALAALKEISLPLPPRFVLAQHMDRVELPDQSVDVLLCFDVLEHIMDYEAIIREWYRVLRPGGRVLIWWVPWWHPYGPHIESLVPIPWSHVFFSERALLRTCARIYDMPEFQPRVWDLDETGRKKPNKWLSMKSLPEVNKLTMGRFERLVRAAGLEIESRRLRGFGSSTLAKLSHVFLHIPYLREFFTSSVVYTLRRPTD